MIATRIGTPSNRPHTPHNQPQASTPTKTATGFILLVRLASQGVSANASMKWMVSEIPPTSSATLSEPNCRNATSAEPEVMTTLPKYGTRSSTPAAMPHTAAFSMPMARNAIQVASPTRQLVNSCTSM